MYRSRFGLEPIALIALVVGGALLALLVSTQRMWESTLAGTLPTRDAFVRIQADMTKAHLALEEALTGESTYTSEQVWRSFDQAREQLLKTMPPPSLSGAGPIAERAERKRIAAMEELRGRLDQIVTLGRLRWEARDKPRDQQPDDREFDLLFNGIMADLDALSEEARLMMEREIGHQRSLFNGFLLFGGATFLLLVITLHRQANRQRRAQEDLALAEQRFREVVDQAGDWIWEVNEGGVYTFASPNVENLLGYPPSAIVGKPFGHLFPPAHRDAQMEAAQKLFLSPVPFSGMMQWQVAKNGASSLFECSGLLLEDEEGRFVGFRGISRDITFRREAEESLTRTNRLLDIIRRAQQAYIANKGEAKTLGAFLDDALELTDSLHGFVAEVVEEGGGLVAKVKAFSDASPEKRFAPFAKAYEGREIVFRKTDSLIGELLSTGQPIISNDPKNDPKAKGLPSGHPPIDNFLGVPLFAGSRIVGVLGLANRPMGYRPDDVTFLQPALGTCANIIEAARREVMRRQAEDQLALASTIFDHASEGVLVTDERSIITSVNRAVTDITGYRAEELLGGTPRVLRSDRHDAPFYKEMWRALIEEGKWEGEVWNRRKDGKAYPQWTTITAVRDDAGKTKQYISVFHDLSQLKKSEEELRYQANHDALTGLPNRPLFLDRLNQSLAWAHRTHGKMAVVFVAIDRFKKINEGLGHLVGDLLLQEVGVRLSGLLGEGDTLARWGSDEFTFILEYMEGGDVSRFASRVIATFAPPFVVGDEELFVTASVGLSQYPTSGADADSLVRTADLAVRQAKERGGNGYQTYTSTMGSGFDALTMERDMRKGLERDEFVVYYQPKLELSTGAVLGMEALIRWRHPSHGLVSPGTFIPLAEESGLIVPIGIYALKEALAQTRRWIDAGHTDLVVSVNLSALQFAEQNLFESIADALADSGVAPAHLEMEITESTVMRDVDAAIETLRRLSASGIGIAIDDFGTGYSSLAYLKRFPIDTLKIDRSFVRDIPGDQDDAVIAQAIISLAHSLGLSVVAEGVETYEQLEFLKEKGCDQMQGFLFSPPVPAERFEELLKEQPSFNRPS